MSGDVGYAPILSITGIPGTLFLGEVGLVKGVESDDGSNSGFGRGVNDDVVALK